jgi:L-aspartate oxidase
MKTTKTDFLIIGSGIAGLTFAVHAARHGSVVVVTKKEQAESNTNYAQGGIAGVFGGDDSFELHLEDTLRAGAGLCNEQAVRIMVQEGPKFISELVRLGARFTEGSAGFDLWKEGGHSRKRVVHFEDRTGFEIERTLIHELKQSKDVRMLENRTAVDLIVDERGCRGVYVLNNESGEIDAVLAGSTMLAAGGACQVYLHTTNPTIATGDGVAMAYRAGARVGNMEFVQFHPTSLYSKGIEDRALLISEATRGAGAVLLTKSGESFMEKYSDKGCLASRDVVARAIDSELKVRGDEFVYLDMTGIGKRIIRSKFPNIRASCLERGIDITAQPIPVVPAAHYMCGGVMTDTEGRTSLRGLYCAGETACTGVHGANRLASNSLLEAVVFSRRACDAALDEKLDAPSPRLRSPFAKHAAPEEERVVITHARFEIKRLMWDYVGIVRSSARLLKALKRIDQLATEVGEMCRILPQGTRLLELRNMVTVSQLVIKSANLRKESRGLHYNKDFPRNDDENWKKDTVLQREGPPSPC